MKSDKEILEVDALEHLTKEERKRYNQLKNINRQRLWYKRNKDRKMLVNLRTWLRKLNREGYPVTDQTREVLKDVLNESKILATLTIDEIDKLNNNQDN